MNYWQECIAVAAEECGLTITDEQRDYLAEAVEGAHEYYGMYHGHECIPHPLEAENKGLKEELQLEKEKRTCSECKGTGRDIMFGPYHSFESTCRKCKGQGRC